jgi:hypothetical protein
VETRLIPFNAWIALMTGEGGWPAPLKKAGFRLLGLEWPVTTTAGLVVVDGLGLDDTRAAVLASESKSGHNVELEQARKYGAMTATEVARQLTTAASATSVQPVFVCIGGAEDRIRLGLEAAGLDAPIIVIGERRAHVDHASGGGLVGLWDVQLPPGPPPRLIPVDSDSPETEFQELLLPAVVAAARRNLGVVAVGDLLDGAMPYWKTMGRSARERIRKKAVSALKTLAAGECKGFFAVEKGGSEIDGSVVRILKSPGSFDPRGETQGWQGLQRKGQRALRGRPSARPPDQLSLEDLGLSIAGSEE